MQSRETVSVSCKKILLPQLVHSFIAAIWAYFSTLKNWCLFCVCVDAPVANQVLALVWLVLLIALFFASDHPLVRDSWLARITYHGKLSTLSQTKGANTEQHSGSERRGLLSCLYLRSSTAWTSFYALAVVWNFVCVAHFALVVPPPPAEDRILGFFQPAALTILIMQVSQFAHRVDDGCGFLQRTCSSNLASD